MAPYWILAAYAAGIGLSTRVAAQPGSRAALAAGLLALLWLLLRRGRLAHIPLAAALALAGFLAAHQALEPPRRADHISRQAPSGTTAVAGVVTQVERLWDGTVRLDVASERTGTGKAAQSASGLVRLTIRKGGSGVFPGDRICWLGRLRRPRLFGTPGEFDYPRYLAARDIFTTSYVEHGADIARIAAPEPAGHRLERGRGTIATAIARAIPGDSAGLVQTLIVGVGGGISPEKRRLLAEGGLAHLFSISGLHFAMLAALAYAICRWLYSRSERLLLLSPPQRVLPLLLLAPLYLYLLLSGNAAPTRRSFATLTLAALLFTSHRRTPPLALLATAALALLLLSPLSLFEPSFQLSFAGVAGLMVWMPRWQTRLDGRPGWLRAIGLMLMTTAAASLATMPVALWHFGQVAPAGLLTNLAAIPIVTWGALPAGLAGALLLPLAPVAAAPCFAFAGQLVDLTMTVTRWCLAIPGLQAHIVHVSWWEGLGALLLAAALLPLPARGQRLAVLVAALLLLWGPASAAPHLRVTAISVGQGDATLLTVAGRHYLVDGGGITGSAVDIGERLVGPALGRIGVHRLAGVILTHDHPDHSAGLPYILDHFAVDGFWSALPPERLEPQIAEVLARRGITAHMLPEGWSQLPVAAHSRLSLYVPPQTAEDPNDRSIVVHAAAGSDGVLLPGDLAVAGFRHLCATPLPEPVTLLKLPHHGSRGSRPEQFLDRLHPDLAFVSAGLDNPYNLPHPASVAACRERGIPLYRTDRQGTLVFTSNGKPWQIEYFWGNWALTAHDASDSLNY